MPGQRSAPIVSARNAGCVPPPAAQGDEELGGVQKALCFGPCISQPRLLICPLGNNQLQNIRFSGCIAEPLEGQGCACGVEKLARGGDQLRVVRKGLEAVGDLLERLQNRLLIGCQRCLVSIDGGALLSLERAAVKNRCGNTGGQTPEPVDLIEERGNC